MSPTRMLVAALAAALACSTAVAQDQSAASQAASKSRVGVKADARAAAKANTGPVVQEPDSPANGGRPVVSTAEGPVRGYTKDGVNIFLGVPYAAPPVGSLRWQPPRPAEPRRLVTDAIKYASSCPQIETLVVFAGPTSVEEDCLYLNVFTRDTRGSARKKPVIVWIHGGGNIDGASNDYDGGKLATGGPGGVETVVVTLNYRLGLFGTFSHPAINSEGHLWGNYGTLDQQAAIRWVKTNIEAFGGDPDTVTVAGQSAGAYNVGANLLSPLSKGLFKRAILQSTPGLVSWLPTADSALTAGTRFAAAAGCPGSDAQAASCLRKLSTARILQLQGTLKTGAPYAVGMPFVDGTIIPMQPEQAWEMGAFNKVPVIGGATRDEVSFFTGVNQFSSGPPQAPISAAQYGSMTSAGAYCNWCNGSRTMPVGVGALYPLTDYGGNASVAYQRIGTDAVKCRELHVLQKVASHTPVYAYDFAYRDAPFYFPRMPGFRPMAAHTIDLQFLFNDFHGGHLGVNLDQDTGMPRGLNAVETKLSDWMVAAWTNFASAGNPNASGDSPWPKLLPDASARYMVLDIPLATATVSQFRSDYKCDFFDAQLRY